jgi:hypothetical protein
MITINVIINVIVYGSILLIIMIMIARNYGIWNMLIYTPLIGIIILLIYAGAGGGLLLAVVIPILGIIT